LRRPFACRVAGGEAAGVGRASFSVPRTSISTFAICNLALMDVIVLHGLPEREDVFRAIVARVELRANSTTGGWPSEQPAR
jgi:hypothetical protein